MALERKIIKGETTKDQVDSIEKVLQNFQRRLSTKVIGFTPPVPFFGAKDIIGSDGVVAKLLIPFDGSITAGYIHIGHMTPEEVVVSCTLSTDIASSILRVVVNKAFQSFSLTFAVEAGSLLTVEISNYTEVGDVQVGFLAYPEMNLANKETYLLEEILKLEAKEEV